MKQTINKFYFFFGSLMMLFAPLSMGLMLIYREYIAKQALAGLVVNLILLIILSIFIGVLISIQRIDLPKPKDRLFLLFGFLANIIIFLFVYQSSLNLEREIDIYSCTLLIVLLHLILVNQKKLNYELFFLSIILLIFYRFNLNIVYGTDKTVPRITEVKPLLRIFYSSIPLIIIGFSLHKLIKYRIYDYINIIYTFLGLTLLLYPLNKAEIFIRLFYTTLLILPFLLITDLILMRVNKNYHRNKILFYLRVNMLIIFTVIIKSMNFFTMESYRYQEMYMYTFIMYVTIFINILEYFIMRPGYNELKHQVNTGVHLESITKANFLDCIKLTVTEEQQPFVRSNVYSLAEAKVNPEWTPLCIYNSDQLVGFVMYGFNDEIGYPWIIRLMIDHKFHSEEFGKEVLNELLIVVKAKYKPKRIYISTNPDNTIETELYKREGFINKSKIEGNEVLYYKEMY